MKFSNINSFNNYFLHILNYSNRFNNSFCLWDKQWNINQSVPQRMLSFAFFILDTFWYRQQPVENKLQQQGNSYDDFTFLSPYSTRFGWRFPFLFIYVTLSLFLYCEVSRGRCCCHFWGIWVASVMFVSFSITPSIHLFLGSSSWSVFFFFCLKAFVAGCKCIILIKVGQQLNSLLLYILWAWYSSHHTPHVIISLQILPVINTINRAKFTEDDAVSWPTSISGTRWNFALLL